MPGYINALGEPDEQTSRKILRFLGRSNRFLFQNLSEFSLLDTIGSPSLHRFSNGVECSGATIRFVAILADVCKHHGSLENKDIVEIGGGFGGQCFVIKRMYNTKSYTIIDLPEVLELQKKVLSTLGVSNVRFMTPQEAYKGVSCDLVISNYAFSECKQDVQNLYLQNVLANASSGYMIMNQISHLFGVSNFTKAAIVDELSAMFSTCRVLDEFVSTYPTNYTIIW